MKHTLILCLFLLPLSAICQQKIQEKDVPDQIRYDLKQKYPRQEEITWMKQGNDFFGARFVAAEHPTEVIYLADGQWYQTTEEVGFRELPDTLIRFLRLNYSGKEIGTITQVTTRKFGVLFDIPILEEKSRHIITFDRYGKIVEEKDEVIEETNLAPTEEKKNPLGNLVKWKN